jgi:protein-S-isoprenylcysteine O-methyltransferase Ste14
MPLTAAGITPYLLLAREDLHLDMSRPAHVARSIAGLLITLLGGIMVGWTITLFVRIGRGTLAPWNPTRHLVVAGPFAHARNPMISGVASTIAGVALATGSTRVGLWFVAFVAANHAYFVLSEEPGLRRRFGAEYDEYAANVPRWWPRLRAYRGSSELGP